MTDRDRTALRGQQEYYNQRAGEYDQWWLRQGRYDRGPEPNARWRAEQEVLFAALDDFGPRGRVLELAGGTGIWSEKLLARAEELTVVDGSAEMIAINAARLGPGRARYIQADLFQWRPDRRYDTIFFGFWLSHVPPERFEGFWHAVGSALAPEGRVFFVDSCKDPTSTAVDHRIELRDDRVTRRLNDGREFQVYKLYYDPRSLEARLSGLGWSFDVARTDTYFLYGSGLPAEGCPQTESR